MAKSSKERIQIVLEPSPRLHTRRDILKIGGSLAIVGATGGIIAACTPAASTAPTSAAATTSPTGAAPTGAPIATTAATLEPMAAQFQVRWLLDSGFAGFFAAIEKGYWAEEALDIEIVAGGPTIDVMRVVTGGTVPIGEGITDIIIRARAEQNVPVKVFGAMYQSPPSIFMSLAEKNITTPADFAGKKLATTAEGVPLDTAMLRNAGVDPETVEFVMSGFDPSPIVTGEADIYQGFKTDQGVTLELQGHQVNYVTYEQFGYEIYDGPIFATEDVIEQNEEMLVRFLRGSIKGWEYNDANPDEIAELVVNKYGIEGLNVDQQKAQNRSQLELVRGPDTPTKGLFYVDPARWQRTIDFLVDAEAVTAPLQATDLVITEIQEQAMGGKSKLL